MRTSMRFKRGLCAAALGLAGSFGLAACGPDYAIYKVQVTSASPRTDIEHCRITITDQQGRPVLENQEFDKEYTTDPGGSLALKQGCQGGITPAKVGFFSYSTSRTSGSLTFKVVATDNLEKPVQQAEATRDVKAYPPEIDVPLYMEIIK